MGLLKALETALEIAAQADPTGPRELARCLTKGYGPVTVQGHLGIQKKAVKILKQHGIKVGGVTDSDRYQSIITVPSKDRQRAVDILNEKL